jgi:hypothetical protein
MCCFGPKITISTLTKISGTDLVRNEVLQRVKGMINSLNTMKRRNAKKIGHILRGNCLLKHVTAGKIEGRMEVRGKRGTRRKQLLYYFKEKRGYWKLKRGSTRSHCLENSSWKWLWTCRKADYIMDE